MQTIAIARLHLKCDKCHAYTKTLTIRVVMFNTTNCKVWTEEASMQSEFNSPLLLKQALDHFGQLIKTKIKEGYELAQD